LVVEGLPAPKSGAVSLVKSIRRMTAPGQARLCWPRPRPSGVPPTAAISLHRRELALRARNGLLRCNKSGEIQQWQICHERSSAKPHTIASSARASNQGAAFLVLDDAIGDDMHGEAFPAQASIR